MSFSLHDTVLSESHQNIRCLHWLDLGETKLSKELVKGLVKKIIGGGKLSMFHQF